MSQISGVPLVASPNQLGQMMLRTGAIPESMVRPGRSLEMVVAQDAKAGEKTQVQIAGKSLAAIFPDAVSAGQRIQVRVTQVDGEGVKLRLVELRNGPPALQVRDADLAKLQSLAAKTGGRLAIQTTEDGKGLIIAGQRFAPAQVGLSRIPPVGRWTAEIRGTQLTPVLADRAQQLRGLAGELVLSKQADLVQTGVEIGEQIQRGEQSYRADGQMALGPAWIQLPDGTPIGISQKPQAMESGQAWSAQLTLHGFQLGEVGIRILASQAGISISVQSEPSQQSLLQSQSQDLESRVRQITQKPTAVQIHASQAQSPQRPPEGYQYYG